MPSSASSSPGRPESKDEAEEMYLDESLPEVLELLREPIPNEGARKASAPMTLLRVRGSRGREDSLL